MMKKEMVLIQSIRANLDGVDLFKSLLLFTWLYVSCKITFTDQRERRQTNSNKT